MDDALKGVLVVELRRRGFTGSLPHFCRQSPDRISLLSIQHFSSGGSFVVELAACPSSGLVTSWGKVITPSKVTARDINPLNSFVDESGVAHDYRPRLGSATFPGFGDHWFVYGPRSYEADSQRVLPQAHYLGVAAQVVALLDPQAEIFWRSMRV